MNNRFSFRARALMTLAVGFLFWSWGGFAGWRTLQMQGMPQPPLQIFKKTPRKSATVKPPSDKAKLELSNRLGDALKDPATVNSSDLAAVKAAWGKEAARMLAVLRDSAK
jgi:hypothetical protein